jgi:hypothetical protein
MNATNPSGEHNSIRFSLSDFNTISPWFSQQFLISLIAVCLCQILHWLFYIICHNYIAEVKVVVVFDAANSGLSTHKETYKG